MFRVEKIGGLGPLLAVDLRLGLSLAEERCSEAGVEDAAGVERAAEAVVEHGQRGDAVQAGRLRGGHGVELRQVRPKVPTFVGPVVEALAHLLAHAAQLAQPLQDI